MIVFVGMVRPFEDVPFILDSVCCSIIQCSEAKVIEHTFHSIFMLHTYVFFQCFGINRSVCNIIIYLIKFVHCSSERPVVLVVPVIELYAVDMASSQEIHLRFDDSVLKLGAVEIADETVTRESCPIARNIDSDCSIDELTFFLFNEYVHHISREILRWGSPLPCCCGGILYEDGLVVVAVSDLCL